MIHILSLKDVSKDFRSRHSCVNALQNVSLAVNEGEALGLIGESGSGKSTLARVATALVRPDAGEVWFMGRSLFGLTSKELRGQRASMQMVFQEPYESLNPRMRVRQIVEEPLYIHEPGLGRQARTGRVVDTLDLVGLGTGLLDRYPRELSGGQQQRVGIARAIVTKPRLIVLDEPTSSLDVSVRATVLNLLGRLRAELGLTYLLISHDIDVVVYFCSRVAVLCKGQIVEEAPTDKLIARQEHPYTRALFGASLTSGGAITLGDPGGLGRGAYP